MTTPTPEVALNPQSPAESLPDPQETLPALVLDALRDGPASGRALAARIGARWSDVFAALRSLVTAGKVVVEGRGRASRYWLLVEPLPEDDDVSGEKKERDVESAVDLPGSSSPLGSTATAPGSEAVALPLPRLPASSPPPTRDELLLRVYCGRGGMGRHHPVRAWGSCVWCQGRARALGVDLEEDAVEKEP